MVPTLVLVSMVVFVMLRVLPGDVTQLILGGGEGGFSLTADTANRLREQLGLNQPLHIQYLTWIWDLVRGDFGTSLYTGRSIGVEMALRLPLTLQLAVMAMVGGLLTGIPIGILSALYRNSWLDYLLRFWSIFFLAAPTFWLGLIVIVAGTIFFMWVPPLGYNALWQHPKDNLVQLMWPCLIMVSHTLATIARMTRSCMLEVMREDYIRTARAKGLGETVVVVRHALKNALIPVLPMAGLHFAVLVGGVVILEYIFGIPGFGSYLIHAIETRDYTIVQAAVMVFAVFFMVINLVVDLLYGWFDPRISYS